MFHSKITDSNKEKVYITGDLHLNHKNITRGVSKWDNKDNTTRDYNTVNDMTNTVIDSMQVIPEDGMLIILGDILFGDKSQLTYFLDKIPCKNLVYVFGNHCKYLRKREDLSDLFSWYGDYLEMYFGQKLIVMCHYPLAVWNENGDGSWMIHGHCHGNYHPGLPTTLNEGKILDIGWDVFKRPVSIKEISEIMQLKNFKQTDHHNPRTNKQAQ